MADNPPVGPWYNSARGIFNPPAPQGAAPWLIGWIGTWFLLSMMAESSTTADLASALAISVAIAATFVSYKSVRANLAKGL